MERYFYPAVFTYEEGQEIAVVFPDLDVATSGENDDDALLSARELLGCVMFGLEEDGESIPEPTPLSAVALEPNERVVLVDVYMPAVRMAQNNKSVNRNRNPAGLAERCRAGTEYQFLPGASGRAENTDGNLGESAAASVFTGAAFIFHNCPDADCTGASLSNLLDVFESDINTESALCPYILHRLRRRFYSPHRQ
ncbi:MAG: type II toxin-antitoxin system HicB family antitoxin [Oscillospiraceae bacterium]